MFTANSNFITRTKLDELRKQRSALLNAYDTLTSKVENAADDRKRLKQLYEGLQNLTFAKQTLHPEVSNLEMLLNDDSLASDETVDYWLARLQEELTFGRARSEFVYIFGELLEQWAIQSEQPTEATDLQEDRAVIRDELVNAYRQPADVPDADALIAELLSVYLERSEGDLSKQRDYIESELYSSVTSKELEAALRHIRGDIYRPASLRKQTIQFLDDEGWRKELADTMTIMLDNLSDWTWPEGGLNAQIVWTRNKWRIFLDEDLPTACLLAILGSRWNAIFKKIMGEPAMVRATRMKRLEIIGADEEQIRLEQRSHVPFPADFVDIFAPLYPDDEDGPSPRHNMYHSIAANRARIQNELRDVAHFTSPGGQPYVNSMETALLFLNTEIQLARNAFPDNPLYVLKIDLQNFYPSIPQEVALSILKNFGIPQEHLDFFTRYLKVPMQVGEEVIIAQRGISNDHLVSHLLAELLLKLMDEYVLRHAQVQVIRVVDDIVMLGMTEEEITAAWNAVQTFCSTLGLTVNEDKSGVVAVGSDQKPSGLPDKLPGWLMLELHSNGDWLVNQETLHTHIEQTRQQVENVTSLLSKVEVYNANLKFLIKSMGLSAPLGDAHRQSLRDAIRQYRENFFGESQGFVDGIRQMIVTEFLEEGSELTIPEAWLYMPITSGGLGLQQPMIMESSFEKAYRERKTPEIPEERPKNWLINGGKWTVYFNLWYQALQPKSPRETNVMETLVDDFINRGSTLINGEQEGLSMYWRWVLYLYGPVILDYFGTFRFLITELVPLQLIKSQRLGASSLNSDSETDFGDDLSGNDLGDLPMTDVGDIPF